MGLRNFMNTFDIGQFTIELLRGLEEGDGTTADGREGWYERTWLHCRFEDYVLRLRLTSWPSLAHHEVSLFAEDGDDRPERIVANLGNGRLRLSADPWAGEDDTYASVVKMARNGQSNHATLRKVDTDDLSEACGVDFVRAMLDLGAFRVDRSSELMDDVRPQHDFIRVVFPASRMEVPVAAFVLSRISPILAGY